MATGNYDASSCSTAGSEQSDIKRKRLNPTVDDDPSFKPYECRFCPMKFSKSQALGGHMNRHRQEREREQVINARQLLMQQDFPTFMMPGQPSQVPPRYNQARMHRSASEGSLLRRPHDVGTPPNLQPSTYNSSSIRPPVIFPYPLMGGTGTQHSSSMPNLDSMLPLFDAQQAHGTPFNNHIPSVLTQQPLFGALRQHDMMSSLPCEKHILSPFEAAYQAAQGSGEGMLQPQSDGSTMSTDSSPSKRLILHASANNRDLDAFQQEMSAQNSKSNQPSTAAATGSCFQLFQNLPAEAKSSSITSMALDFNTGSMNQPDGLPLLLGSATTSPALSSVLPPTSNEPSNDFGDADLKHNEANLTCNSDEQSKFGRWELAMLSHHEEPETQIKYE